MDPRSLVTLVGALLITLSACSPDAATERASSPTQPHATVSFPATDAVLMVEVADDDAERAKGLMGRTSLGLDAGMVFVWESPTSGSFWMKDTLIPLSIAFWDEDGTVVAMHEMTPCDADPCPTFGAPVPYVAAVEASAGWFAANGIEIGDRVDFVT